MYLSNTLSARKFLRSRPFQSHSVQTRHYSKKAEKPVRTAPVTLLIDASPIIYQCYYGMDLLSAPGTNIPTHGIFGFLRKVCKMITLYQPDYAAVCLDGGKTFRNELSPLYKATRKSSPDELRKQFELAEDACKAIGIPSIKIKGYEADDLIAALALQAQEAGHDVKVISPDKDLHQVVAPTVQVINHKSATKTELWDVETVTAKWSVSPHLIPHVQALCGDSSDNIKGIPGIGIITAKHLVQEFGTVQNLLSRWKDIKDTTKRELIGANAAHLETNIRLTSLVRNIEEMPPFETFKKNPPDLGFSEEFCKLWGFDSVLKFLYSQDEVYKEQAERAALEAQPHYVFPEIEINSEMSPEEFRSVIHNNMPGVTYVNDKESAEIALKELYSHKGSYHACDVETIGIDLDSQSPVGNGQIICVTVYVGPTADFGHGPRLFIDNLDFPCLHYFKDYFEDVSIKKAWHNYGFDRHQLGNHGVNALGFGGDTMHMARLYDASRQGSGAYSLAGLTYDLLPIQKRKRSMKERFGVHPPKVSGGLKKEVRIPPLEEVQRSGKTILEWIDYASLDTDATWHLRELLHQRLDKMEWQTGVSTMWDFYQHLWLPFGELLTDMERDGIRVDVDHMKNILPKAQEDKKKHEEVFLEWAESVSPGCKYMNPTSDTQKQQLLFAPAANKSNKKDIMPAERTFNVENKIGYIAPNAKKQEPKKDMPLVIKGLGLPPTEFSASGWPAVGAITLNKLAGKPPKSFGTAKAFLDEKGLDGSAACHALSAVIKANAIDTLISGFIETLPAMVDSKQRVHCSLNLNTETGRLSARRPNLQNQPALDKDIYKIRKAFCAEPGNTLIVADYGQLELRLLAHVSNCKSMIDAFKSGGDFHSRTAIGMYPHIQEAVKEGKVLLEWDTETKGPPPVPLIKDAFANERKKAKTLNFSIAYGKTVHGFAKDWSVSVDEAKETLAKWYADRPEVKSWQDRMIQYGKHTLYTRTLMGRYRPIPGIKSNERKVSTHSERVCINTPLQGGASDIMVSAMLKLSRSEKLKRLGWKQILQIHDELIFEGPKESAEEALQEVVLIMENPLENLQLEIDLVVDANIADNWYEAK